MHATLTIDLSAIRANYRLLRARHAAHDAAAVVKANAYGLGVNAVSRALWDEGCRRFFVATLAEGIELRAILPEAQIGVFNGLLTGEEGDYRAHKLMPVLNDPGQVERFFQNSEFGIQNLALLHVDTGMTRLGLSYTQLQACLPRIPNPESRILLMSHLACANDAGDPKNAEQLQRFNAARALLPGVKASLANSAGIFLSPDFHFDLARPGCALYGINPVDGPNPMKDVATLGAPILQLRTLDRHETVGYGATCPLPEGSRLAIVALGYADGWPRLLSNSGHGYVAGHRVALAGRVSMDMLAIDITQVPEAQLTAATRVEFINAQQTVNDIADACGTIGYEIFTRIGARVKRVYG